MASLFPEEWKALIAGGSERGLIYTQFVAQTAMCCGEGGIKAWDYVRMGFLSRVGVLNNWLTEEESLWLQSRVYVRAHHYYHSWMHYFSAYSLGRLYWQSSQCEDNTSLREALTLYKYDSAGVGCSKSWQREAIVSMPRFLAAINCPA